MVNLDIPNRQDWRDQLLEAIEISRERGIPLKEALESVLKKYRVIKIIFIDTREILRMVEKMFRSQQPVHAINKVLACVPCLFVENK